MEPGTTPLSLYLEKLASGDRELAPIVCQKLAQQLVYVPFCVGGRSRSEGKLIFQAVKLPEGSVPVFTTEVQYKEWAAKNPEATEVFTVLGGDLCATVGERATVILDIGTPHSSILDQALMQLVATAARESLIEERSLRIEDAPRPLVDLPVSVAVTTPESLVATPEVQTSPSAELSTALIPISAQPTEQPATSANSETIDSASIAAPIPNVRGRSHPTSIMPRPRRPQVSLDDDVHHRRAAPALPPPESKPVIRTDDPDSTKLIRAKDDPKKSERRSLLKFLGG